MRKILIISILLIVLIAGGYWYYQQPQQADELAGIVHSNGRLELARTDVASLYAGRVEQVLVDEGQAVQQGDLLVKLSSQSVQAQHAAAQAQYEATQAKYNAAQAHQQQATDAVERANAQIKAQQQQLQIAQLDVDNALELRKDNLISKSELAKRIATRDAAKAQLAAITFRQDEATAGVAQAEANLSQAQATIEQSKAQVSQVNSILNDLSITAPKAGRIQYKLVEVGNVITAGAKVVSLLDLNDVSMTLFLPGPVINQVSLNSEARIVLDGLDYVFPATVSFIADDAQFTPKFVETDSERAKLMFKVKLKIPTDIAHQHRQQLHGGMRGNGYLLTTPDTEWTTDLQVKLPELGD